MDVSNIKATPVAENNDPHVKRAVFRLPYKGLLLHMPLKGHVKD